MFRILISKLAGYFFVSCLLLWIGLPVSSHFCTLLQGMNPQIFY